MRHIACAALILAAGCAGKSDTTPDSAAAPSGDQATTAAVVSNAIAANPSAADSILKANGYTAESFDRALYEIAADSVMSARYAAAKSR